MPVSFTFKDLLRQSANRFRDRVAVLDLAGDRQATYGELDGRANRLAHGLVSLGLKQGDVVALCLPNGLAYLEAEFAVGKAGLVRVGLMPRMDDAGLSQRLAAVTPGAIVVDGSQVARVREICSRIGLSTVLIAVGGGEGAKDYEALLARHPDTEPALRVEPGDPCSLRFTSGSSGTPKAVLHDQKACAHFALVQLLQPNWGRYYGPDERYLQHAHLSTGIIMWLHATYASGGLVVILPDYAPEAVLKAIQDHRITLFFATPAVMSEIVEHPRFGDYDTGSVKTVMVGGAPFTPAKRAQATKAFGDVFIDYYSATEYPLTLTMQRGEHRDGALGRPNLGVQVRVVGEDYNELPPGEVGRLVVRGDNVLQGYWKNPEVTEGLFHDGWVDIGDLARMDADGVFSFAERESEVIRINGCEIFPTQVEAVLTTHAAVREVSVFAVGGPEKASLQAALTFRDNQSATAEELIALCREKLSGEAVPQVIHFSAEPLPKNPLGKIMRRMVRDKFSQDAR